MSLTIKAFLQKDGKWDAEIRRFQVPADVSSSYDYLSKKLCDIFPALRQGNFSLFWKDPDGDHVAFSTDEEQMEALGFVSDGIFKIYIILKDGGAGSNGPSSNTENETVHPGVICDGCEGPICGPRYKCMVCPDYDLCKVCEGQGKHTQHDMMKITTPGSFPGFPNFFAGGFPPMFGAPPHGPAGPHGPGPFGPGPNGQFAPPPHFRRWMQKFMRRWHNRNAPGCSGEAGKDEKNEGDEKMDEGAESQNAGDEFLRQVGESVATMLDPLGIDVDVHIETPADKEQAEAEAAEGGNEKKGRRGGCGRRGRGGGRWGHHGGRCPPPPPHGCPPWKMWGWMGGCPMDGGFEAEMGCGQGPAGKCGKKGEKKKQSESQKQAPQNATAPPEPQASTSMEPEVPKETEKRPESPVRMESEPSGQKDNTWTLLNVTDESSPSGAQAPAPSAPAEDKPPQTQPQPQGQPLYPPADPKIAEALQQMMAMGFSNEGGWLTNLLESKNGDIIQVLDVLRPVQRPRSNEDGTLA